MEKDEYEQHTVEENVVAYVQEQPLTDDEQKLHLKSFLVLIVSSWKCSVCIAREPTHFDPQAIAMLNFCQIYK